jgi:hypothetical protein
VIARATAHELLAGEHGLERLNEAIVRAMEERDLSVAGALAAAHAAHAPPEQQLSISKLRHDAEQFRYLRGRGLIGAEFDSLAAEYERIADRLAPMGINARTPLEPEDEQRIGHVFNRVVHTADAPRLDHALAPGWDRDGAQHLYLDEPPGVVVIDDFLSEEALEGVRRFCLESTVWTGNRYADGRLGAFFFAGFNSPLLLQIAEEVRAALPSVIGDHPLRQLWGFKNSPYLPADSTIHADFAAVNVNFWITPEAANLDESSGGLVVYDVAAPLSWDFRTYNERIDLIREYLQARRARAITIPYRQNRAIIFNSDLFHATSRIHFRPEYENRRVNVTMLFGDREHDDHHPAAADEPAFAPAAPAAAWRSNAFSRRR